MFNVSQGLIAALEGYIISGKWEQALLYGGSTFVATGIPDLVPDSFLYGIMSGAAVEKQIVETTWSGIFALLGQYLFSVKPESHDAKHKYVKTFAKAFIITGSSAGLNEVIASKLIGGNSYAQAREALAKKKEAAPENYYPLQTNILY